MNPGQPQNVSQDQLKDLPKAIVDNISYIVGKMYVKLQESKNKPVFPDQASLNNAVEAALKLCDPKQQKDLNKICAQLKNKISRLDKFTLHAVLEEIKELIEDPIIPIRFKINIRDNVLEVIEFERSKNTISTEDAVNRALNDKLYSRGLDLQADLLDAIAKGKRKYFSKDNEIFTKVKKIIEDFKLVLDLNKKIFDSKSDVIKCINTEYQRMYLHVKTQISDAFNSPYKASADFVICLTDKQNGLLAKIDKEIGFVCLYDSSEQKNDDSSQVVEASEQKKDDATVVAMTDEQKAYVKKVVLPDGFQEFEKQKTSRLITQANEFVVQEINKFVDDKHVVLFELLQAEINFYQAQNALNKACAKRDRIQKPIETCEIMVPTKTIGSRMAKVLVNSKFDILDPVSIENAEIACMVAIAENEKCKKNWEVEIMEPINKARLAHLEMEKIARAKRQESKYENYPGNFIYFICQAAQKICSSNNYDYLKIIIEVQERYDLTVVEQKSYSPEAVNKQFDIVIERINKKMREENNIPEPKPKKMDETKQITVPGVVVLKLNTGKAPLPKLTVGSGTEMNASSSSVPDQSASNPLEQAGVTLPRLNT